MVIIWIIYHVSCDLCVMHHAYACSNNEVIFVDGYVQRR